MVEVHEQPPAVLERRRVEQVVEAQNRRLNVPLERGQLQKREDVLFSEGVGEVHGFGGLQLHGVRGRGDKYDEEGGEVDGGGGGEGGGEGGGGRVVAVVEVGGVEDAGEEEGGAGVGLEDLDEEGLERRGEVGGDAVEEGHEGEHGVGDGRDGC